MHRVVLVCTAVVPLQLGDEFRAGDGVGLTRLTQGSPKAFSVQPSTNPGTRVEPQQIVAQRLLSCVQYPVLVKSSTEDLT